MATGFVHRNSRDISPWAVVCTFFAVALLVWRCGIPMLNAVQSEDWVPLDCNLTSAQLVHGRGLHLSASYSYRYQSRTYSSSHIDFYVAPVRATDESYELFSLLREGVPGPMRCYVNPEAPKESVVSRKFLPLRPILTSLLVAIVLWFLPALPYWVNRINNWT